MRSRSVASGIVEISEPQAGHRVRLAEGKDGNGALVHVRQRRRTDVLGAVEDDVLVGLVRDQPEPALADNRGDAFEVGAGQDAAGRIVRRVDVDRAGRRGDARLQLVEVEAPVETLVQRATHRTGLRGEHVAGARRPRRVRQDHFVAGLEQGLADEIQRMNAAGRHHHLVRRGRRECRWRGAASRRAAPAGGERRSSGGSGSCSRRWRGAWPP